MADFGWQVLKLLLVGSFAIVGSLLILYVCDKLFGDWRK